MKGTKILKGWLLALMTGLIGIITIYILELKNGVIEDSVLRTTLYVSVIISCVVIIGVRNTIIVLYKKPREVEILPMQLETTDIKKVFPITGKPNETVPVKETPPEAERSKYTLLGLEQGVAYEELVQGMRVRYEGKDFYIWDRDQATILLATGDASYQKNGFIENKVTGNYYKIIDKTEAEEIFYLSVSAVYCGIKCGVSSLKRKEDGKICLTAYPRDGVSEQSLLKKGFEKYEEEHPGHSYIRYELFTMLDNPDLKIIKNKSEHSSYQSGSDIKTELSTREQWIDFLAEKLAHPSSGTYMNKILLGLYGCAIPGTIFSTDMVAVIDEVIPKAFELRTRGMDKADVRFQSIAESFMTNVLNGIYSCEFAHMYKNVCWVTEQHEILFRSDYEGYIVYMKLNYYDIYLRRIKDAIYPYTYARVGNTNYWLKVYAGKWLGMTGPVYWGGKLVCENLGAYVQAMLSKFQQEYGMEVE